MSKDVDLSALRMERKRAARKPLGPRVAAIAIVIVVVAVAASFIVPLLTPARAVTTVAVRIAEYGGAQTGATVAEAAGWIEPDPFPIVVRPLVSGVLTELVVLEGHAVKKGETLVGRLESAKLLAQHDTAKAKLALSDRLLKEAQARLEWAKALLAQKADVRTAEAEARRRVEITTGRLGAARAARRSAEAEHDGARADLGGQEKLVEAGGTYPVALAKARAAVAAAAAEVVQREAEMSAVEAELARDKEIFTITKEVLDDPRALTAKVALAQAAADASGAANNKARTDFEIAKRELDWCTVKAPIDGVVLKLLAAPGAHVGPNGHGIVALYDPKRLQARIDVPLASVGNVRVGQEVALRTEVLPGKPTKGVVVRIQRESDLLKNTLQVKVRLIDPDPLLRPETLCRALFLANAETGKSGPAMFLVPRTAVRDGAVFVIGDGRARRVTVETVGERGDSIVVRGALSPTHRVILEDVSEGERVQ